MGVLGLASRPLMPSARANAPTTRRAARNRSHHWTGAAGGQQHPANPTRPPCGAVMVGGPPRQVGMRSFRSEHRFDPGCVRLAGRCGSTIAARPNCGERKACCLRSRRSTRSGLSPAHAETHKRGDRRQETDKTQETGDTRRKIGKKREERGDRRQETRERTGDRRQETKDRRQETGDRMGDWTGQETGTETRKETGKETGEAGQETAQETAQETGQEAGQQSEE